MDEKKRRFLVALILIVSFLRILSVFTISNNDLIFDEVSHMNIARGLAEGMDYGYIPGEGYSEAFRPPLYPLALSFFFLILGSNEILSRSLSAVFGILSILTIYFLGKKLYSKEIGIYSALILSLIPTFWFYSSKAMVESAFIFFVILFLYVFYLSLEDKRYLIPAGVLLALVFLTKYTGIIFGAFFILFVLIWKRGLIKSVHFYLFFAVAFLVISPWILLNIRVYGTPLGSGSFLLGQNLGTDMLGNFDLYYLLAIGIETSIFIPFMLVGFYFMFKKRDRNFLPFILLFLVCIIPLLFFEVKRSRYVLPLIPIFTLAGAYFFEELKRIKIKDLNLERYVIPLLILLLVGSCALTIYGFDNYPRSERFKIIPEAGAYLQENCMDRSIYSNVYNYVWWYTYKESYPLEELDFKENNICVLYDFFYTSDRFEEDFDKNLNLVLDRGKLKIYQN